MLEAFRSDDNLVGKYIHADNSETSIKCVSSCDTIRDPATGEVHVNNVDRQKYSIFLSSSSGCFMKCRFCYLTIKQSAYTQLTQDQIIANAKEAVVAEAADNPAIRDRWVKLNWMGMGEDHMLYPQATYQTTMHLVSWLLDNGYAKGIDGIDLASVIPRSVTIGWPEALAAMEEAVGRLPRNPNNALAVHSSNGYNAAPERSRVRLFYSLHSAIQETRDNLIPKAKPLVQAAGILRQIADGPCNLIFHHMFLDGQNDSQAEVDALVRFMQHWPDQELRILRYNSCQNTPMHESPRFDEIVARLAEEVPFLKVQISTGTEVRAACGQFVVRNFRQSV